MDDRPWSVLVVTTLSGKVPWMQMAPEVLPGYGILEITTKTTAAEIKAAQMQGPVIYLAHYNLFVNEPPVKDKNGKRLKVARKPCAIAQRLLKVNWSMTVLDEAHKIKGKDNQWTKNIKKLKTARKHIMTGSGFVNDPSEVWSLLNFLDKKRFPSYWDFRWYYCLEEEDVHGFKHIVGIKHKAELQATLRRYGPRRTKAEVFPDLPGWYHTERLVDLNPAQRRMYNELKSELKTLDEQGEPIHSPNVMSKLVRLRQICVATPKVVGDRFDETLQRRVTEIELVDPSAKLDELMNDLDQIQGGVVVFSNFTGPLKLLEQRLKKAQIGYTWMVQKDSPSTRRDKVDTFQRGKGGKVFMSTIKLGGESITLTHARTVAFLDEDWAPANNNQAIARVWRPGQNHGVQVLRYQARGTVDQYVKAVNRRKHGWFVEVFGDVPDATLAA